jgi:O-antigen/teichoic acid export membrane protein
VAFLAGLVAMARYSVADRSWPLLTINLAGAGVVVFTLGVNLSRVYPLASLAAAVGVGTTLYALWVRAGRPRGVAGALANAEASPREPVGPSRA